MASLKLTLGVAKHVLAAVLGHDGTLPVNLEETEYNSVSLKDVLYVKLGKEERKAQGQEDGGVIDACKLELKLDGIAQGTRATKRTGMNLHLGHDG